MASNESQAFRFLDLPNELQGRIYDRFLEDMNLNITLKPCKPTTRYSGVPLRTKDPTYLDPFYLHLSTSINTCRIKRACRKTHRDFKSALKRLRGLYLTITFTNPDLRFDPEQWTTVRSRAFERIISRRSIGWLYDRVVRLNVIEECAHFNPGWCEVICAFPYAKVITASVRHYDVYRYEDEATFRRNIRSETAGPMRLDYYDVERLSWIYHDICKVNTNSRVEFVFKIDLVSRIVSEHGGVITHRAVDKFRIKHDGDEILKQWHNTAHVLRTLNRNRRLKEQADSLQVKRKRED